MKRANACLVASVIVSSALAFAACGTEQTPAATNEPQPKASQSAAPSGSTTPAASQAPSASESATPEPSASASDSATPEASASAPEPGGSAQPKAAKEYNCGGKGQKACPMQGWMKGVMAGAMSSGDNEKIANALNTIASKPVAGFGQWSAIAAEGAAKAKAGDIEGAKGACKKCHSLYQKQYKDTMRDQPW